MDWTWALALGGQKFDACRKGRRWTSIILWARYAWRLHGTCIIAGLIDDKRKELRHNFFSSTYYQEPELSNDATKKKIVQFIEQCDCVKFRILDRCTRTWIRIQAQKKITYLDHRYLWVLRLLAQSCIPRSVRIQLLCNISNALHHYSDATGRAT